MTAPYTQSPQTGGYSYNPYGQTFSSMQTQGVARPPSTGGYDYSPYQGGQVYSQPSPSIDPYSTQPSGATVPPQSFASGSNGAFQPSQPTNFSPTAVPDLGSQWSQLWGLGNVGYGAPSGQRSDFNIPGYVGTKAPANYQGPGQFGGYNSANYDPGAYQNGSGQINAPNGYQQFNGSGAGGLVDMASLGSILQSLQNPSRYGSAEAGQAFNLLNDRLTQQGNADYKRINADMASRGIYDSTTAGGQLGDLATNLNQQRADYATSIAQDQARQYASDRAQAISQAMGYGGQQFGQSLGRFQANQGAQAQNFGQGLQAGQFNEGLSQNAYQNNLGRQQFLLGQNQQNFGQQAQQYGLNQNEAQNRYQAGLSNAQFNQTNAMNKYNSGLAQANFGLAQNQQNYNQSANQFNQQQGAQQQTFNQLLAALTGQQGYQQQGYNNQLTTQALNNEQQNNYMNYLMQMFGASQ